MHKYTGTYNFNVYFIRYGSSYLPLQKYRFFYFLLITKLTIDQFPSDIGLDLDPMLHILNRAGKRYFTNKPK